MRETPRSPENTDDEDEYWKGLLDSSVRPTMEESITTILLSRALESGFDVSRLIDFETEEFGTVLFQLSFHNEDLYQRYSSPWLLHELSLLKREVLQCLRGELLSCYYLEDEDIPSDEHECDVLVGNRGIKIDLRRMVRSSVSTIHDDEQRARAFENGLNMMTSKVKEDMDQDHEDIEMWFHELAQPHLKELAIKIGEKHKFDAQLLDELADRYLIIGTVGKGAFGEVYLAEDLASGRVVAIKVMRFLPHDHSRYEEEIWQFKQEMRIMASVEHPNIVSIISGGYSDYRGYFVMNWVDGQNVQEYLKSYSYGLPLCGTSSRPGALDIMIDVFAALKELHYQRSSDVHKQSSVAELWLERRLFKEDIRPPAPRIHRDIKPANVLLGKKGAQLTDFGIAVEKDEEQLSNTQKIHLDSIRRRKKDETHRDQYRCGTPHYCPPEYLRTGEVSESGDVYAAAVMLYLLLTRRFPVQGSRKQLISMMIHGSYEIPALSKFRLDVPQELEELILNRMLSRDPHMRLLSDDAHAFLVQCRDRIRSSKAQEPAEVIDDLPASSLDQVVFRQIDTQRQKLLGSLSE